MARRQTNSGFSGYDIVNIHFNEREKEEFNVWFKGKNEPSLTDLLEVVEGGFKVSLSFDKRDDTFLCSLTGRDTAHKKLVKKVFMLKHKDGLKIFGLALYFWSVIVHLGEQMPKDMVDDLDW